MPTMIGPSAIAALQPCKPGLDDAVDEHHLPDGQREGAGDVEVSRRRGLARGRDDPCRRRRAAAIPIGGLISSTQRQVSSCGDDPAEQHARRAAEAVHRRPRGDRAVAAAGPAGSTR